MYIDNITHDSATLNYEGKVIQIQVYEKEIKRLINIINELESYIKHYDKIEGYYEYEECGYDEYNSDEDVKEQLLEYIKELKEW